MMTINDARQILGVTDQDDLKTIKSSFRKQMAQYHPDAVGVETDEVLKRAQAINEAYTLLQKTLAGADGELEGTDHKTAWGRTTPKRAASKKDRTGAGKGRSGVGRDGAGAGKRGPAWESPWAGEVIADAFVERRIYRPLFPSAWEEDTVGYEEVAKGPYAWDPELESFPCLLCSINAAAIELLEGIERQRCAAEQAKTCRFPFQTRLFHLLAGQFIRPVSCLRKLARPERTDAAGREIYRIRAFLGTKERRGSKIWRALSRLEKGELLYAASLKDERLMAADREGTRLGPLSFAEDMWYYVAFPILKARKAQIKLVVDGVKGENVQRKPGGSYRLRVDVDMYLRMDPFTEPGWGPAPGLEQDRQIRRVLEDYGLLLDTLSKA